MDPVESKTRIIWLDYMRGFAIIAVVVCHQQYILHSSEYVQFATLYSVTSLIFLMGVTKGISIDNYLHSKAPVDWARYTIKSLSSPVLSYVFATYIICKYSHVSNDQILQHLISFDAVPPFYYIKYIILFSLLGPILYYFLMLIKERCRPFIIIAFCLFLILTWVVGYLSIDYLDVLGQSYLAVYVFGMILSLGNGIKKPHISSKLIVLDFFLLGFGIYAANRFYFSRVAGNYSYSELIDVLDPKLQLNPPNLSVILFSASIILAVYLLSSFDNILSAGWKLLGVIGKYSMDIFIWHISIRNVCLSVVDRIDNIWIKRVFLYFFMIGTPVIGRYMYNKIRKGLYGIRELGTLSKQ